MMKELLLNNCLLLCQTFVGSAIYSNSDLRVLIRKELSITIVILFVVLINYIIFHLHIFSHVDPRESLSFR